MISAQRMMRKARRKAVVFILCGCMLAVTFVHNSNVSSTSSLPRLRQQHSNPDVVNSRDAFENLGIWLKTHVRRPFIYFPNPGNLGDSLIALGTLQLFERLSLPAHQIGEWDKQYTGQLLIFPGGGNFVEYATADSTRPRGGGRSSGGFLRNHRAALNNTLILLPHTVRGFESLLSSLGPNVWLWAREQTSFDYLKSVATGGAHVQLSHDLALYAVVKVDKIRSLDGMGLPARGSALLAFRTDREAPTDQPPWPMHRKPSPAVHRTRPNTTPCKWSTQVPPAD